MKAALRYHPFRKAHVATVFTTKLERDAPCAKVCHQLFFIDENLEIDGAPEDGIDETSKRKLSGKKKEMRIDRGPNEFIHVDDNEESRGEEEMTGVEFGTREDPTVQGSRGVSPEADPELVPYVRRPAAVEATSRLSFYTYTDKDVEVGSQSQDSQEVPNRNGHAPSISVQQQSRIPEIVAETASDYDEQVSVPNTQPEVGPYCGMCA